MSGHYPVMLAEVLAALSPKDGETYVDGTFGGGGYSRRILEAANCCLIGIDRDETAIERAQRLRDTLPGLIPVQGCFGDMDTLIESLGEIAIHGVVLDLGVSSFQLDEAERGFSFMRDGPLDMRMGGDGPSAADVVNHMTETDIAAIIFRLGEEKQSRRIARAIVRQRAEAPFQTTLQLANLIETELGGRKGSKTHPATRTFQAIRIYINDELGELIRGLNAAEKILCDGGRLVVVTFHSLEDRIVKAFFRNRAGLDVSGSRHQPEVTSTVAPSFRLTSKKALAASNDEISVNARSRSAKLRVAIRTDAPAMPPQPDQVFNLPPLSELERAA
ncbi:MAG: 16S rRNA (cytosine(1402)-N(4))-methyltransferase RsmH [Pseudomonadota bacterium]